ncbi:hypothetical protein [Duganella vulcania]|uniref:Large polyvalent protein-associated domain-containing protein n=1 Tax=Duganella vulcania TaxID=2692166 RepID=A0A845GS67_9BURK|nr:hypothetical protein [Duganella vulcania]MYM96076.1 hypothetical protein [Duganella vulcania]
MEIFEFYQYNYTGNKMTLIRVTGARKGIKNYLIFGTKKGRESTRDELDERIPFGNIDLMDEIINSIKSNRIKYHHMTLSLKEDMVDASIFASMLEDIKKILFSAYHPDEYNIYAEIHLPRKKRILTADGKSLIRLPHMHIITPNLNLLSNQAFNPWGNYNHNIAYFDAIQEYLNRKYGTISPRDSGRNDFTMQSNILQRSKGDVFLGDSAQFKSTLLCHIMDRNISTTSEFRAHLKSIGNHKTVNLGRANEYEAIKPPGHDHFINLRHNVFKESFLALSHHDKKEYLSALDTDSYKAIGSPRRTDDSIMALITDWNSIRAKEIKYFPGGLPKAYKAMGREEKLNVLRQKEIAFYNKIGASLSFQKQLSELDIRATLRLPRLQLPSPSKATGRRYDTAISQKVRNKQEFTKSQRAENIIFVERYNQVVDLEFLLQEMVDKVGLVRSKYQIAGQDSSGGPPVPSRRIRCGNRHLNAIDFLTQELRMPFGAALSTLKNTVERQSHFEANCNPDKYSPEPTLWRSFTMTRRSLRMRVLEEYRLELQRLRDCLQEERSDLDKEHSYRRFALYLNKMPRHFRELFLADVEREYQTRRTSQRFGDRQREFLLRQETLQIKDWALYQIFLRSRGDEQCVTELRRHAVARATLPDACFIKGTLSIIDDKKMISEFGCIREVLISGDIVYSQNGRELLHDQGNRLLIIDRVHGVPFALALAHKKWGYQHAVAGPEDFLAQVKQEMEGHRDVFHRVKKPIA